MGTRKPISGEEEFYDEHETVRRREAALKRMLTTPPKPHSEMKGKRPKSEGASSRGAFAKGGEPSA